MKLKVKFDFLQKPGLGPIKLPPKHTAISVGHFMHSPGLSIIDSEKDVLAGQSKHLYTNQTNYSAYCPESVNFSPG